MEKLILPCGRYIPQLAGDTEARVQAMESYLARLGEELEVLLGETARALDDLRSAQNRPETDRGNQGGGV